MKDKESYTRSSGRLLSRLDGLFVISSMQRLIFPNVSLRRMSNKAFFVDLLRSRVEPLHAYPV